MAQRTQKPQAELHAHLGSSVDPAILWSIAHRQGIKLPTKNYWEFEDMIAMAEGKKNKDLQEMHFKFFAFTELIQSSPEAVEESVRSVIGGGYRKSNITLNELRFDPMFRNRSGERDLDYIIKAALWGVDRALLEYPQVKAGVILMMHRLHSREENEIIIKKAIKYKNQGVVGVDLAGPNKGSFNMKEHTELFELAKNAGLGITVHTGEEKQLDEMRYVVDVIRPHRIGHGVLAYKDKGLMKKIVDQNIYLEICPSSNIKNSVIKNYKEMRKIYRILLKAGIKITINTDGPEMYRTHILNEQEILIKNGIFSEKEIDQFTMWAFEASFIK
jgi:adenosine deaminase